MSASILLPDAEFLRLNLVLPEDGAITLVLSTIQASPRCPACGEPASRIHSTYTRAPAPAVVSAQIWEQAQQVLHQNRLFSGGAKRLYLLRGLAKCSICGSTFVGTAYPDYSQGRKVYYVCGGKNSGRGTAALQYRRCPSKAIRGDIEEEVWRDIEGFLRHPGEVLQQLAERLQEREGEVEHLQTDLGQLRQALQAREVERERVVALYRRGRIEEKALDQQLDEIDGEEKAIKAQMAELEQRAQGSEAVEKQLRSAEELLLELGRRLDQPLEWELKRQLVETLVESIRVDTVEQDGKKQAVVTVTYRFTPPATCTGRGSWRPPR